MSSNLVSHSVVGQSFGYSAVDIDYLCENGTTEYTLVTLVVDESSSVAEFQQEMEDCIKKAIEACKLSPRSDYLLVRVVAFSNDMREIHGYKQLVDCDLSNYDNCLRPRGMTMLYDTFTDAVNKTKDYGDQLCKNDFDANAIVIVITDGMDNMSSGGRIDTKNALTEVMRAETLESIVTILVGVGVGTYQDVSNYLDEFKDEAGLSQYVELKDADEKTLGKLADFISKSVSSQSQALNSGGQSQPLTF
jgi:uncharacterized protein YegL